MKLKALIVFMFLTLTLSAQESLILDSKMYIDHNHSFTIDSIYAHKDSFVPSTLEKKSVGVTEATVWVYAKVTNTSSHTLQNVIQFPYPLLENIHALYYENGTLVKGIKTGYVTPFDTRVLKTRDFVFPYSLEVNQTKEFIFKINSNSDLSIQTTFLKASAYFKQVNTTTFLLALLYGAVLIMLIYNLILYFLIKDRVYLYYVTFHFWFALTLFSMDGLTFMYLTYDYPELNLYLMEIETLITTFFGALLAVEYLNVKKESPNIYKLFKLYFFGLLGVLTLVFFLSTSTVHILSTLFIFIGVVLVSWTAGYIYYSQRTVIPIFYLISESFLNGGIIIGLLAENALLPLDNIYVYAPHIGTAVEMSLLSILLAYRYNITFDALVTTKAELKILNRELEDKVTQRTLVLDEKNNELLLEVNNKNVLLKELYHRVKNNLQIISGILSMQSSRIKNDEMKELLKETNLRIKAMSIVHEKLYRSNDLESLNMQSYLIDLINELENSFNIKDLDFDIKCKEITLILEYAVPMGLIINELITNTLKYAFDETQKKKFISIEMYRLENDDFMLEFFDNGKGMDMSKNTKGFGLKLLDALASYQLKGNIETFNKDGLHYKIIFPKDLLS